MKLEELISLISQLNSQPFRDPDKMIKEVLDRVERYSVSPDGYKIPLTIRYKNKLRRLYVVVSVDREKKLLLVDWRYLKPEEHELIKTKRREQEWKTLRRVEKKYIRMYFKLKRYYR